MDFMEKIIYGKNRIIQFWKKHNFPTKTSSNFKIDKYNSIQLSTSKILKSNINLFSHQQPIQISNIPTIKSANVTTPQQH